MTIKFQDSKGATSTVFCKDLKHYQKIKMRFNNKGWKQVEYIKATLVENYPF
jgi:hypothetical protein